jgi:hypothetical protein
MDIDAPTTNKWQGIQVGTFDLYALRLLRVLLKVCPPLPPLPLLLTCKPLKLLRPSRWILL